jgi:ribonuclease BN (tRNA processing enzyme)
MEHIKVLGAYGTKAKGFGTTSFALNNTDVIDAGNLLDALGEETLYIENIWLTHSHLDHIVDIAYIIDNYFEQRTKTLNIYGTKATLHALQTHFLNDIIWPDFSKIQLPNGNVVIKYIDIELNKIYKISENESIQPFETEHTVCSCGYIYTKNGSSILITADTCSLDTPIKEIEKNRSIHSVVIECSFPSHLEELALSSKHLTPKLLFTALEDLKRKDFTLYINHIKPAYILEITQEIEGYKNEFDAILVKDGKNLHF